MKMYNQEQMELQSKFKKINLKEYEARLQKIFAILFSCLKNKLKNIENIEEAEKILNQGTWGPTIKINYYKAPYTLHLLDEASFNEFYTNLYNNFKNNNSKRL